ncbi:MAG: hypothetical protein MMC23_008908 [Stictis urceolatum]|nr:hypothetical protein [Stictis urceolata]
MPMARSGEQMLGRCYQKVLNSQSAQVPPVTTSSSTGSGPFEDSTTNTSNSSSSYLSLESFNTSAFQMHDADFFNFELPDNVDIFADVMAPNFNAVNWIQSLDQTANEDDYMTWYH